MKKMLFISLCVMALLSIGIPYIYAETLSDDYEFAKMLAYDKNSPDGSITTDTTEINLGVVIKNSSKLYAAKFASLDFYLTSDLENIKTGPTSDRKVTTIVGQCQNFSVSARGTGIAICSTMGLTGPLESGQYLVHAMLRNSIPTTAGTAQFNSDVKLECIITVKEPVAGQQTDTVLQAVKDVNTNVMNTQSLINTRMSTHEANLRKWGSQIYGYVLKIYNIVNKTRH